MTISRVVPDAILAQTNLTGTLSAIDEDPDDAVDTTWLTASGNNVSTDVRVSFPTTTDPLTVGTNGQEFRARVRRFSLTQTGVPTARIELWAAGALVRAGSNTNVGTVDTVLSFAWDESEVANRADVECKVVGTATGGSPSVRNTVEVGAVEWNADTTVAPTAVGNSLDTRWSVSTKVTDDLDARWTVSALATDNADLRWSVSTAVAKTVDARWSVTTAAGTPVDLRWSVSSPVATVLDLRWSAGAAVASSLDTRWSLSATATKALDTRWSVSTSTAKPLGLRWSVDVAGVTAVGRSLDTRWALLSVAGRSADLRWVVDLLIVPGSSSPTVTIGGYSSSAVTGPGASSGPSVAAVASSSSTVSSP